MKYLKQLTQFLAILALTTSSALAAGSGTSGKGPGGTGGGDALKSTHEELENITAKLYEHVYHVSDSALAHGDSLKIMDRELTPQLKEISTKVLGSPFFTINHATVDYLAHMKFDIVDTACYEGAVEKDASTPYEKNARVCLSALRLSRFPRASLKIVILPILFHEMAHQFQLGESEANALQELAGLQLEYRPIFVSAYVGRAICAQASQNFDAKEKFNLILYTEGSHLPSINTFGGERAAKSSLIRCGSNATATYRGLDELTQRVTLLPSSTLTAKEKSDLLAFAQVPTKNVFDLDEVP